MVAADNSTVVTAKYDLIRYTLIFNLGTSTSKGAKINLPGGPYSGNEYRLQNVVLGQDVSSAWPTASVVTTKDRTRLAYWNGNWKTKRFEITADMLPAYSTEITYDASWTSNTSESYVQYWIEKADGTGYEIAEQYSELLIDSSNLGAKSLFGYKNISRPSGYPSSDYQYVTIDGTRRYIYVNNFYYSRSTSSIEYRSAGQLVETKTGIKYGANINNSAYNYVPSRPSTVDNEATFGGWYDNSGCVGDPYAFGTMPAGNLVLYAKWVPAVKTVTIDLEGATIEGVGSTITINKGDSLASSITNVPTKPGYTFVGWQQVSVTSNKWIDLDEPVMADMAIRPVFVESDTIS